MGAAASIHAVYAESTIWFREYFDSDLYRNDFEAIDKDGDGGISYSELSRWVKAKVEKEGGSWKVFLSNPEVIQFAHEQSCTLYNRHETVMKKKVIGIDDFRAFLVHFFAISVLWVHFKNADEFKYSDDFGDMKLSFEEFHLAVKTLTATHAHEECTEEQLAADFKALDKDNSNSLGFIEVCSHCCKYIDPTYDPSGKKQPSTIPENILALQEKEDLEKQHHDSTQLAFIEGMEDIEISEDVLEELEKSSEIKRTGHFKTVKSRNLLAVDALQQELDKEKAAAKFEEVKYTTKSEMDKLLQAV